MNFYRILIPVVLILWSGMILAISFMEAPLKFTAPGITTELGLGIGRIVFHTLNRIECIFAIAIMISFYFVRPKMGIWLFFSVAGIILIYQTLFLLPQLDVRALELLSGNEPPTSYHHLLYIAIEGIKVIAIMVSAVLFIQQNIKTDDTPGSINPV